MSPLRIEPLPGTATRPSFTVLTEAVLDGRLSRADLARYTGQSWHWCHREMNRVLGRPLEQPIPKVWTLLGRIADGLAYDPNGCWLWVGQDAGKGYGVVYLQPGMGARRMAHRAVYEHLVGPIPEGLELDHLCRNKRCCRPDHLEPVTGAENMRRAYPYQWKVNWTHCRRGHEFTPENTGTQGGRRRCKTCKNGLRGPARAQILAMPLTWGRPAA